MSACCLLLLTDCSLKALADKVALKWQKYLQFKAEIYLAYVGVLSLLKSLNAVFNKYCEIVFCYLLNEICSAVYSNITLHYIFVCLCLFI